MQNIQVLTDTNGNKTSVTMPYQDWLKLQKN